MFNLTYRTLSSYIWYILYTTIPWQIDGGKMEIVAYFIFWGSRITADGYCSHDIKKHLLLGRKAMTNLDRVLKSTNIANKQILLTKACIVKVMVFPVAMCRCESWTIKQGWTSKNWCFPRIPSTARGSNKSILKEINSEYSSEGLMLKLRLQYFGHLMLRADPLEKRTHLDAGKGWRQEEKGATEDEMIGWHHWLNKYEFEQTSGDSDGQGSLACCIPWGHKELDRT